MHASAEEAAQTAAEAGAYRLILVHLPPGLNEEDLDTARQWFSHTELGQELGIYELSVVEPASPPSGP